MCKRFGAGGWCGNRVPGWGGIALDTHGRFFRSAWEAGGGAFASHNGQHGDFLGAEREKLRRERLG